MQQDTTYVRVSPSYLAGVFYACAILAAAACVVIGSVLPWGKTDIGLNSFAGPTITGMEAGGLYSVVLAGIATASVLGFLLDLKSRWFLGITTLVGALIAVEAADWWIQWDQIDPAEYRGEFLDVREGLYLTLTGGVLIVVFSLSAIVATGFGRIKQDSAKANDEALDTKVGSDRP